MLEFASGVLDTRPATLPKLIYGDSIDSTQGGFGRTDSAPPKPPETEN
jgi:hypothetical protein